MSNFIFKVMSRYLGWCTMLFLIFLGACGSEKKNEEQSLPQSKGIPYELLLVVDQALWQTPVRDSLEAVLKGSVPGLPQHEPMFKMIRIFSEKYVQMYTTMRNTLFVSIDSTLEYPKFSVAYDVKAKPQVFVSLKAPDVSGLLYLLSRKKQEITDYFVESELSLEAVRLEKKYHLGVAKTVGQEFGYRIHVPAEIRSMKHRKQFLWASTELIDKDLNFVMYTFPYSVEDNFSEQEFWVLKRDSALKVNIPGSRPDQWMTTVWEQDMPVVSFRERTLDGMQAWELRGLWEMRNGAIGGPFVSLARIDTAEGRVVVCEGFVYSPRTDKRNLLRRMEASLRTLEKIKK